MQWFLTADLDRNGQLTLWIWCCGDMWGLRRSTDQEAPVPQAIDHSGNKTLLVINNFETAISQ